MKHLLVLVILSGLVGALPVSAQGNRTPMTPQNAASITQLAQLGNGRVNDIAWAPDGSKLAIAGAGGIRFYDPANPIEEQYAPIDYYGLPVLSVAYSPDGSLLAWCDFEHLTVSDGNTGMILWAKETRCYQNLAFSPDGVWLVSYNGISTISLWNAVSGALVHDLTNDEAWQDMAFLPDGTVVAGSYDGHIHWLDVRQGSELRSVENPGEDLRFLAASPEGDLLAASGLLGDVILWQAATGQQVGQINTGEEWTHHSLLFAPNHKLPVTNSRKGMVLWDTDTSQVASEFPASQHGCEPKSFSPDWQTLAMACPSGVTLFDMASRTVIHVLQAYSSNPVSLAFSPDGSLLAASYQAYNCDDSARLWHTGYGRQLAWFPGATNDCFYDVIFNADGSLLGTSSDEGLLQWWRTRDGSPDAVLGSGLDTFDHAAISPDGAILAVSRHLSNDERPLLQLWDTNGSRMVFDLSLAEDFEWVEDMVFGPDGSQLAAAGVGNYRSSVYLIDSLRGTIEHTLGPYDANEVVIRSLAYSADGTILAYVMDYYGSASDTVILWNVPFGVEMGRFEPTCGSNFSAFGASTVAISPVSDLIVVGCGDSTIELWNLETGIQQSTLYGHRGESLLWRSIAREQYWLPGVMLVRLCCGEFPEPRANIARIRRDEARDH